MSSTVPTVSDVRLDPQGTLRGQLVNLQGQPVADQPLELHRGGQTIARASSRADGEFVFQRLPAGVYQIRLGSYAAACRAWTADAAPPSAQSRLIMLSEPITVRGQQPIHEIFRNPLFIGLVVAAAIAIPVAIHNSQDDKPSGS
ncbi:MAG: carboxypeptidase-like regulatory domain-containing protein [Planctomycetes bacterium]|nr:carboxypeptidase-like regulatory domain-containing protein [Planctomycetota bacterium]